MLNNVFLTGRLTHDVEIKLINDNFKVGTSTLAVNSGSRVDYIDIEIFNNLVDTFASYTRRGSLITIRGKLTQKKYQVNGSTRNKLVVSVDAVDLLDRKEVKENEEPESKVNEG